MSNIRIWPEPYTMAIGGVVAGKALEIELAMPAARIGGMGFTPAPNARLAATDVEIIAAAVFEAA